MKANTYLLFDGDCEAACAFYERTLGAKTLSVMRYDGAPGCEGMSADWKGKVLHARFALGDVVVMASDCPPDRYVKPQGYAVTLNTETAAEADRLFQALAEGAQVTMPIDKTFFAERFGMLIDKFGIPWMVSCERPT